MELNALLSPQQQIGLERQIESFNKSLLGRGKDALDREDFLKILITQLTHQDPTQPMEDREFIAQMAQFSTLEQMIKMGDEIGQVSRLMAKSQAYTLLGKTVTIRDGEETVTGRVDQVQGTDLPQLLVGDRLYDFADVETVTGE
jgi:flagellar basal-body rod modification protein FlgD